MILSATDEKSLDFREKLITSQQTIEDLKVDAAKMESGLDEMRSHRVALAKLAEIQSAIQSERVHDRQSAHSLRISIVRNWLTMRKPSKCSRLQEMKANIEKDLAAGLITKADAASQLAALNQTATSYTDSRIAEVLLTDSVVDKHHGQHSGRA